MTLSTLEAMFTGQTDLFKGLKAEQWVQEQAQHPSPVLRFDISTRETGTSTIFYKALKTMLTRSSKIFDVKLTGDTVSDMFEELIEKLYEQRGQVVVLIDEYDKPILDNLMKCVKFYTHSIQH